MLFMNWILNMELTQAPLLTFKKIYALPILMNIYYYDVLTRIRLGTIKICDLLISETYYLLHIVISDARSFTNDNLCRILESSHWNATGRAIFIWKREAHYVQDSKWSRVCRIDSDSSRCRLDRDRFPNRALEPSITVESCGNSDWSHTKWYSWLSSYLCLV